MTNTSSEPLPEPARTEENAGGEEPNRPVQDGPVDPCAKSPPKELGVMLLSAGLVGFVLPGPGIPALLAGGLILWPRGFGKIEGWMQRRFPETHRAGRDQLDRFLSDLERRYPGSTEER
jgi:hypothetical protein